MIWSCCDDLLNRGSSLEKGGYSVPRETMKGGGMRAYYSLCTPIPGQVSIPRCCTVAICRHDTVIARLTKPGRFHEMGEGPSGDPCIAHAAQAVRTRSVCSHSGQCPVIVRTVLRQAQTRSVTIFLQWGLDRSLRWMIGVSLS